MSTQQYKTVPLVYIVLLNWNGWKDTLECLESVFRLDYPNFRVVVCDNDSHDGSLEKIKDWACGILSAPKCAIPIASAEVELPRPIQFVEYNRQKAESGDDSAESQPLVLIQTGGNLGFAGGNNVGMRYALAKGDADFIWLLNNDTVIEPDALTQMVRHMAARPDAGICGSKLVFYHNPGVVQAWGGATYHETGGYVTPLGMFESAGASCNVAAIEHDMAYVVGASMLVSSDFLQQVGLMTEDYFLYFEEIDWACRAKGRFSLAYAERSVVYHKEGGSIGSSSTGAQSPLATRLLYQNRIRFIRRFYPQRLPRNLCRIGFELLVMLKRRQFAATVIAAKSVLRELLVGPRRHLP